MQVPNHLNPTVVTANGRIVRKGKPNDGLIVVDEMTRKPVVSFDEVSGDDEVVHVFCKFAPGAAFGRIPEQDGEDESGTIVGSDGYRNTHEILIRKDEHRPLERVDPCQTPA